MKASPSTEIKGMGGKMIELGDPAGFQTSGYINKKGTPHGDGATFNAMPPGMDITNQDVTDQRPLPMKKLTSLSYPGDGWGAERDIPE